MNVVPRRLPALVLTALAVPATTLCAQRSLQPGVTVQDSLAYHRVDGADSHTYEFAVPDDTLFLRIELVSEQADLDMLAVVDADGWALENWAETGSGREVLELHSFHQDEVLPGRATVEVLYQVAEWPRLGDRRLDAIEYELRADLITGAAAPVVDLGSTLDILLEDRTGRLACYGFDLPASATALRVDVLEADGDVDLLLKRGMAPLSAEGADHVRDASYGRESLVLGAPGDVRPRSGRWYLLVFESSGYEGGATRARVRIAADPTPPPEMLELPELPAVSGPAPHQLYGAVVQLFVPSGHGTATGSAVLVSPDGLLLTAAHVVADLAERPLDEVVVAVCSDPRRPPRAAYRARVLMFDMQLDLALLEIDAGLLGQPLPDDHDFPWLSLGDAQALRLGDPVRCVAYPGVGGLGSLVTLNVSGGVLSGTWDHDALRLLKTDADIAPGSSGGALIDAGGRVVAILSDTVEDAAASSSFARSIDMLPPGWRAAIEERLPR